MNVKYKLAKGKKKLVDGMPTILSFAACGGVVGTGVLSSVMTIKAMKALEDPDLTDKERAWICIKYGILPVGLGVATIASILGANVLNKKQQAAITSLYMMADQSLKELKKNTAELYGEDAVTKVQEKRARTEVPNGIFDLVKDNEYIFWDPTIPGPDGYFIATMAEMSDALTAVNTKLQLSGYATVYDYFFYANQEANEEGREIGWSYDYLVKEYGVEHISIDFQRIILNDGEECLMLVYITEPSYEFMDY